MTDDELLNRITLNPAVLAGKPVIRGTRLSVDFVLNLRAHGATEEEILAEYSGLTADNIRACEEFNRARLRRQETISEEPA
jgi:uncharacterized protein (DUF433 family)